MAAHAPAANAAPAAHSKSYRDAVAPDAAAKPVDEEYEQYKKDERRERMNREDCKVADALDALPEYLRNLPPIDYMSARLKRQEEEARRRERERQRATLDVDPCKDPVAGKVAFIDSPKYADPKQREQANIENFKNEHRKKHDFSMLEVVSLPAPRKLEQQLIEGEKSRLWEKVVQPVRDRSEIYKPEVDMASIVTHRSDGKFVLFILLRPLFTTPLSAPLPLLTHA